MPSVNKTVLFQSPESVSLIIVLFFKQMFTANLIVIAPPQLTRASTAAAIIPKQVTLSFMEWLVDPILSRESILFRYLLTFFYLLFSQSSNSSS